MYKKGNINNTQWFSQTPLQVHSTEITNVLSLVCAFPYPSLINVGSYYTHYLLNCTCTQ